MRSANWKGKKKLMGWGQDKTRQDMKLNRYMQEH